MNGADPSLIELGVLVLAGLGAGFVNAVAGGGSLLTLPALFLTGMDKDVANATNRVGVALQSYVGVATFEKHDLLERSAVTEVTLPSLVGAVLGAFAATRISSEALTPVILLAMVTMGVLLVWKPSVMVPSQDSAALSLRDRPFSGVLLFLTGIYGGFLQVGVGFLYLGVLGGMLRYDFVRANALKLLVIALYTTAALVIFVWQGMVLWVPGLALALGTMTGARYGVRFAIGARAGVLRVIVLVMILLTVGKELFLG